MDFVKNAYAAVSTQLPVDFLSGTPIKKVSDLLGAMVNIVFYFGIAICLVFAIAGGIKYATSGGDPKAAGEARNTITNAVIGFIVVIGFYTILKFVITVLGGEMPTGPGLLPGY